VYHKWLATQMVSNTKGGRKTHLYSINGYML